MATSNSVSMVSTKSGSSPTFSQRRDGSEDTVVDTLRHHTPQRRQCMAEESTPSREEVNEGRLAPLLAAHHLPDTDTLSAAGQPVLGANGSSSLLAGDPTRLVPTQTGRRLDNVQSCYRSVTSREIMVDILVEAIEITAEYNVGVLSNVTTGDQDPTERDIQHRQQEHS